MDMDKPLDTSETKIPNRFSLSMIHQKSRQKKLFLNSGQMQFLRFTCGQIITLQIGMVRTDVKIDLQNLNSAPDILYINKSAAASFPYIMGYRLNVVHHTNNLLILGSTLGYNVSKKTWNRFTKVASIRKRAYLALEKGILFSCFCLDHVDWRNKQVNSYCMNPHTHKWEHRKLPVPQVFYYRGDKVRINNYQHKGNVTDIHWINAKRMFGKWETHLALQHFEKFHTHLPETTLLSLPTLKEYSEKYQYCFVKNNIGSCGHNVFRIEKQAHSQYICSSGGSMVRHQVFSGLDDMYRFLNKTMRKSCIIQQGISLAQIDGCPFDMRILIQKNIHGIWELSALNFRIASPDAVVTNFSAGARDIMTVPGDPLPYPHLTWSTLNDFSLAVAYALETSLGSLGEIGLDVAIDNQGNLWVIEANSRPNIIAYRNATDEALTTILGNPLDYSVFLNRKYYAERSQ